MNFASIIQTQFLINAFQKHEARNLTIQFIITRCQYPIQICYFGNRLHFFDRITLSKIKIHMPFPCLNVLVFENKNKTFEI